MPRTITRIWMFAACAVAASVLLAAPGNAGAAELAKAARMLPEDTLLVVVVENVNALRDKAEKTTFYGLYKEPAMQAFVAPIEKNVREKIDELLSTISQEAGMAEPLKKLPLPEGRVVFAVRLTSESVQVPNYVWSPQEGRPMVKGTKTVARTGAEVILVADMGENLESLRNLLAKAVARTVEKGGRREDETIRGQKVTIVTPAPRKPPESPEGAPLRPPPAMQKPLVYAFKGKTVFAGSSINIFKQVLACMGGVALSNLAGDADMKAAFATLGGEGDISIYLNAKPLIKLAKAEMGKDEDAGKLKALGIENITGLAAIMQLAPRPQEDLRFKALLAVRGQKTGIPALLTPITRPTRAGRMLPKGLTGFLVANYDLGSLIDRALKMVGKVVGKDLGMQFQQDVLAATAGPEGNPPPLDLNKDILSQIGKPIVVTTRDNDTDSLITVMIGVNNGQILDKAIGRLHQMFIARGKEGFSRQLKDHTIYLLPILQNLALMMGQAAGRPVGPPQPGEMPAVAVVGTNLVFGRASVVEQAIRNLTRTDVATIEADPMYQYASRFLPAQAGLWGYANQQASMRPLWKRLRTEAKKAATAGPAGQPGSTPGAAPGPAPGPAMITGPAALVQALKDVCDLTALPEYSVVKKYFGASVGYVIGTDAGILMDSVYLKPQGYKPPE